MEKAGPVGKSHQQSSEDWRLTPSLVIKMKTVSSQQEASVGKVLCGQGSCPEITPPPQIPHTCRRREVTPQRCPLTSHMLSSVSPVMHTHSHNTEDKFKNEDSLDKGNRAAACRVLVI